MSAELQDRYDHFLNLVDNRSFSSCDTLSGEMVTAVNFKGSPSSAVLVFERKGTNKPHVRTVVLGFDTESHKWHVRSENTVVLPTERPSDTTHVVTTSNTRGTVRSARSVTISGRDVDKLRLILDTPELGDDSRIEALIYLLRRAGI